MKKFTRGFTLIELLVVIAIIGILASIVLVSLNGARKKGQDTRVISDVQQTRTALESGYNSSAYPDLPLVNNTAGVVTYVNNTVDYASLLALKNDASSQQGSITVIGGPNVAYATAYAIYGQLVSNTSTYFCIDSSGKTDAAYILSVNGTALTNGNTTCQ